MMQQLGRQLWRSSVWICVLLLLLTSLYVGAGRILTPMLNAYRIEVQDWLGSQLGQPLHVGRLHAGWHGLSPRFYAEDVRLGEPDEPLHIERLHFRPDMLGSLLRGSWSLSAVSLQGLEMELQQQDGGWRLNGMELDSDEDRPPADWAHIVGQLERVGYLSLMDVRLQVRPEGAAPFVLEQAGFTLEQRGKNTHLQASLTLPDGQPLALALSANKILENWGQPSLDAYLSVPGSNWLQWLPAEWQSVLPEGLQLKSAALAMQVWLQVEQGQVKELVLDSAGGQLQGHWQQQVLDVGLGRIQGRLTTDSQERLLWLPELNVRWLPQGPMQNLSLQARQSIGTLPASGVVDVAIGQLELEPLMAGVLQHVPLPELAHDILQQLDFRGQLRNTRLRWTPGLPWQQQLEYDTNILGLDYSPWEDVPGATGISGRLFGSLAGGELHLDSDGFSLYLRELFATPWQYHKAKARLTWELAENLDFTLASPYLQVSGDEGELAGDFVIHLPTTKGREPYMDLRVGMRDGDASYKARYLPLILRDDQPELWSWLHEAIQGGDVHQGYFQYQGSLAAKAPASARSISLYFDVSEARLAYQPGWPVLEQGRAQVFVHDDGVEIEIERGRILQTEIRGAHAEVRYSKETHAALQVEAKLDSSLHDALHIVQQTPLTEQLPFMADWQGEGGLSGSLNLSVPFGGGQPVHVLLDLQLDNNSLQMPALDIELDQLQGALTIDSLKGLTSPALLGRFLEQPFTASMRPQASNKEFSSQIRARGSMPVTRLKDWLGYRPALPFAGSFAYQLDLSLTERDSQLAISTDLQGVSIDLPAPLAKQAAEKITTSWHMTLDGAERHYRLVHGTLLNGLFAVSERGSQPLRGELVLGGRAARLPAGDGLRIRGDVTRLQVPDWLAALERYAPPTGENQGDTLQELQLDIGQLEGFGIPLEQAQLGVWPSAGGWLVQLVSKQAKGNVRIPAAGPLSVDFERLQLPALESDGGAVQAADGLTPADVLAMQVSIAQLVLGSDALGTVRFTSRPDAGGVHFESIVADLKGLQLQGDMYWGGKPAAHSSFKGELSGTQLEKILQEWGYAKSISSERFAVGLDLNWPGVPQDFAMARLSGVASLKFRKGQLAAVDGSAQALRVFGLLNFDAIGRRLRLDFSDLWSKGLSYDRIDGVVDIEKGIFRIREALTLEGVSSDLSITGLLDVPAGQVNAEIQVAMPISRNLPLAAVAVGAPAIGGALFVIDRLVGDRFARMAAVRYKMTGDWQDPQISLTKGGGSK